MTTTTDKNVDGNTDDDTDDVTPGLNFNKTFTINTINFLFIDNSLTLLTDLSFEKNLN